MSGGDRVGCCGGHVQSLGEDGGWGGDGVEGYKGHAGTTMTCHRMAEKGIYLTPTLSCYGTMARPPFEDFLNPEGQVKNRQVMQQGLQALKVARPSCSLRSCCADWMGW